MAATTSKVTFTIEQQAAIDRIVETRLLRERRLAERQMRVELAHYEKEIERLQLELRAERGLITRVREWLGR